jgi:glutathione peroxidase
MKWIIALLLCVSCCASCSLFRSGSSEQPMKGVKNVYDLSAISIEGEMVPLSKYRGKVLLVVNTASKCGFTAQYKALEEIYLEYHDLGFEVLGFPSNDFLNQEPGTNDEIKQFCKKSFGVTFPLFQKVSVTGPERDSVFQYLTRNGPAEFTGAISWNFEKFLLDRTGTLRGRWGSFSTPNNSAIKNKILELLQEPS